MASASLVAHSSRLFSYFRERDLFLASSHPHDSILLRIFFAILVVANMLLDAAPEISRLFRVFVGTILAASMVSVFIGQYKDYQPCEVLQEDPLGRWFGNTMSRTQVTSDRMFEEKLGGGKCGRKRMF